MVFNFERSFITGKYVIVKFFMKGRVNYFSNRVF